MRTHMFSWRNNKNIYLKLLLPEAKNENDATVIMQLNTKFS